MTTTTKITAICITSGACQWGPEPITSDEAAMRQAAYETIAAERIEEAYPDADVEHDVDRRTDAALRVTVYGAPDTDGDRTIRHDAEHRAQDAIRDILGATWEAVCAADCRDADATAESIADAVRAAQ